MPLIFFFKLSAASLHLCLNTSSLRLFFICFSFLFHNYPPPPAACILVAKFTTSPHPSPFSLLPWISRSQKHFQKNSSRFISASIQVTPLLLRLTFSTPLAHLSHILTPWFISSLLAPLLSLHSFHEILFPRLRGLEILDPLLCCSSSSF